MPFFSVIVPAFNVDSFIEECITSLLVQTFSDFEIVAVNDGSTDNTLSLLHALSTQDKRLTVYSKKNEGLSLTRNFGVEKSSGEYIIFLDSDDALHKDALLIIQKMITSHELDVLKFGAEPFIHGDNTEHLTQKRYWRPESLLGNMMTGRDFFTKSVLKKAFYPSACLFAVRRDISCHLAFFPDVYFEDNLYTTQLLFHPECKRVMAIPDKLYCRRIRAGSITTRHSQKHADDLLTIFTQVNDFLARLQTLALTERIATHKMKIRLLRQSHSYLYLGNRRIPLRYKVSYTISAIRHCYLSGLVLPICILQVNTPVFFHWLKRQIS